VTDETYEQNTGKLNVDDDDDDDYGDGDDVLSSCSDSSENENASGLTDMEPFP
jgi:hypothetical protein